MLELFLILQILNPDYPSYAMGLLIGFSVIHSFVEAGEMKEKEIYDQIATSMAEDYEAVYYSKGRSFNSKLSACYIYTIHR